MDEFRRHWGLVLASHLGLMLGVSTMAFAYTIGIFTRPLMLEFGWSDAQILAALVFVTIPTLVMAVVAGWIADRYGVRRVVLVSQLAFGLSFFAIALFVTDLASFYALYALMALCGGGTIAVTFAKLLTLRFVKHRGLALGFAMAGTGLCSVLVQPYAAWVVEHHGWRAGYVALGLLPLLVGFPASWLFVRDDPGPVAAAPARGPDGGDAGADAGPRGVPAEVATPTAGVPWRRAILDRRFWAMGLAMALCSAAMTSLIATFVPMLEDRGYDKGTAAWMAGSFGFAVIGGRVLVGFLIDRWWAPLVGFCFFLPAAIGIAVLALVPLSAPATIACIALAGLAAGAEVDLLAYLVSRYFGQRDFGRIYAGQYLFFVLGPGVLVPLFGVLRAATQGYQAPVLATAAGVVVCGLLLLSMGRYPRSWA
jgi:MFS family permease